VRHWSAEQADAALSAALAELEAIEQLMSLYRPSSQLCQLNREKVLLGPDPRLVQVLKVAGHVARRTAGAFDITVQPLWKLYHTAARAGTRPDRSAIDLRVQQVGWERIELQPQRVSLHGAGTELTLNGIAQGYAADRVMRTLRRYGIVHALVDTGELVGSGRNSDTAPWRVGVQHPRHPDALAALTRLDGRCLATSGDYESTFTDDFTSHHILDPRQGSSPRELASVSVLASSATLADALSTALLVMGGAGAPRLLRSFPGTDVLLIDKQGRTQATPGFPLLSPWDVE
jgi:thiamine biosynthesis lipoprotein